MLLLKHTEVTTTRHVKAPPTLQSSQCCGAAQCHSTLQINTAECLDTTWALSMAQILNEDAFPHNTCAIPWEAAAQALAALWNTLCQYLQLPRHEQTLCPLTTSPINTCRAHPPRTGGSLTGPVCYDLRDSLQGSSGSRHQKELSGLNYK